MKKSMLRILLSLALVFAVSAFAPKAYAGIISVSGLNNKSLFEKGRVSVSTSTTNSNYKNNKNYDSSFSYIYSQNGQVGNKVKVGTVGFSNVGCEIAAMYNATMKLTGNYSKAGLSELIKLAETKKYLMGPKLTVSTGNSVPLTISVPGYFGTDPFYIPNILSARGYVTAARTFTSFNDMNNSIVQAKANKYKKVYIVSSWNYDTVSDCVLNGSGFHTVCCYTENGNFYSFNNGWGSERVPHNEGSLGYLIAGSSSSKAPGRFIVGYEIMLGSSGRGF